MPPKSPPGDAANPETAAAADDDADDSVAAAVCAADAFSMRLTCRASCSKLRAGGAVDLSGEPPLALALSAEEERRLKWRWCTHALLSMFCSSSMGVRAVKGVLPTSSSTKQTPTLLQGKERDKGEVGVGMKNGA